MDNKFLENEFMKKYETHTDKRKNRIRGFNELNEIFYRKKTRKESYDDYYKKNREDILEYSKEYYKNKLTVNMVCDCGSIIKKSSKCLHLKSKKHKKLMDEKNIYKNISKIIYF